MVVQRGNEVVIKELALQITLASIDIYMFSRQCIRSARCQGAETPVQSTLLPTTCRKRTHAQTMLLAPTSVGSSPLAQNVSLIFLTSSTAMSSSVWVVHEHEGTTRPTAVLFLYNYSLSVDKLYSCSGNNENG